MTNSSDCRHQKLLKNISVQLLIVVVSYLTVLRKTATRAMKLFKNIINKLRVCMPLMIMMMMMMRIMVMMLG